MTFVNRTKANFFYPTNVSSSLILNRIILFSIFDNVEYTVQYISRRCKINLKKIQIRVIRDF